MAAEKITFIGHSTLLIEAAGKKVLTDPWFNEPVYGGIYHRRSPGIPLENLGDVDIILISHEHKDHYDENALGQLNKEALVILPTEKIVKRVQGLGYSRAEKLEPWERKTIEGLTITALPAKHPVYQVGYLISGEEKNIYFAGDTRSMPELSAIAEKFEIDVALLPIAGLKMLFFIRAVMGPEEAAEAAKTLKAKVIIPIHYDLSLRSMARLMVAQTSGSIDKLKEAMKDQGCPAELVVLNEGESYA
jgi:L-ascorbate metabolism protein UlaG (beta-lactamase superfamily)